MADNHFMYWIRQLYGHNAEVLRQEPARCALARLLVQEEIDNRLQFGTSIEQHMLNGWASVSPCAHLGNGARATAPGLSFHERTVQRLQHRERHGGRSTEAHTASVLLEQLKPRDQAALLLTGYQLQPVRQREAPLDMAALTAMATLPPRDLTLEDIWSLQQVLSRWLNISLDRPFPSAQALQRAGVRARGRLMSAMTHSLLAAGVLIA